MPASCMPIKCFTHMKASTAEMVLVAMGTFCSDSWGMHFSKHFWSTQAFFFLFLQCQKYFLASANQKQAQAFYCNFQNGAVLVKWLKYIFTFCHLSYVGVTAMSFQPLSMSSCSLATFFHFMHNDWNISHWSVGYAVTCWHIKESGINVVAMDGRMHTNSVALIGWDQHPEAVNHVVMNYSFVKLV